MTETYQEHQRTNFGALFTGILVGGLASAIAVILFAPQSGKETQKQIEEKATEWFNQSKDLYTDTVTQIRNNAENITLEGREKLAELTDRGREIAMEQMDRVTQATKVKK
jgi:gas vesicle protein